MALRAIPGVGSKMAERILLDLRDRIEALAASVPQGDQATQVAETSLSARDQTLSALRNLGYSQAEAERVLVEAEKEAGSNATLESLVRASLKRLG
jgi:Holliday junction DNA helicase RuvA